MSARTAVVTGASAGIGAATARLLAADSWHVVLGARRRVTEILPGMVETEFSGVRFGGDEDRAAKVYEGSTPLRADDVAECIRWAASLPSHVDVDSIVVKPRDQADVFRSHRRTDP